MSRVAPHRLAAAALGLALAAGTARADTWTRFRDPQSGTSVELPASRFRALPAGRQGAGTVFASRDGRALLSVYGDYLLSAASFPDYTRRLVDRVRRAGTRVTYTAGGRGWFVYSGYRGPRIVYEKVILSCRRPLVAHHMVIDYATSARRTYDPITARLSQSLEHLNAPPC